MAGLISELIDILEEEALCYDELVALSIKKKGFVIRNKTNELKAITSKENTLAGRVHKYEKNRMALIKEIANVLNEKEDSITLAALAETIKGQDESEKLLNLAKRLKKSLDELKDLNNQNKILIDHALDYIDFSINVMRSTVDSSPTMFSATGEEISFGGNLFDTKN